jgi:hypothetical protein
MIVLKAEATGVVIDTLIYIYKIPLLGPRAQLINIQFSLV